MRSSSSPPRQPRNLHSLKAKLTQLLQQTLDTGNSVVTTRPQPTRTTPTSSPSRTLCRPRPAPPPAVPPPRRRRPSSAKHAVHVVVSTLAARCTNTATGVYGLRGEPALPSPSPRPLSADSAHAPRADSPSPCAQNTVSHALARIRSTLALHRLGDGRPLPASTARPLARARQQPGRLAASPRPHHSTARPPGARPAARGRGVRANSARSSRSPRQPDRPGHAHPPGSRKDRISLDMVLGHPYFVAARRLTTSTDRHPGALAPSPDRHHAREAELTRAFSVRPQVRPHRHVRRAPADPVGLAFGLPRRLRRLLEAVRPLDQLGSTSRPSHHHRLADGRSTSSPSFTSSAQAREPRPTPSAAQLGVISPSSSSSTADRLRAGRSRCPSSSVALQGLDLMRTSKYGGACCRVAAQVRPSSAFPPLAPSHRDPS